MVEPVRSGRYGVVGTEYDVEACSLVFLDGACPRVQGDASSPVAHLTQAIVPKGPAG